MTDPREENCPPFIPGEPVIVPFDGRYYNAVCIEPEKYWPEKKAKRQVRVQLDTGQKLWCNLLELVKRSD